MVWVAGGVAAVAMVAVTAQEGLWFVPFLAGLMAGVAGRLTGRRIRVTLPVALVVAVAGWAAPLWAQALAGRPTGATARVLAALAGLPAHAAVGVAATLAVAAVQAVAGHWAGRAITTAVRPHRERGTR